MSIVTFIYTTRNTKITGGTWQTTFNKIGINDHTPNGASINLPHRPEDAAVVLNKLIDAAESILATIPGHHARTEGTRP
jgi:hypothetical protein